MLGSLGVVCMRETSSDGHERVYVVSLCPKLIAKTAGPVTRGHTGGPRADENPSRLEDDQ